MQASSSYSRLLESDDDFQRELLELDHASSHSKVVKQEVGEVKMEEEKEDKKRPFIEHDPDGSDNEAYLPTGRQFKDSNFMKNKRLKLQIQNRAMLQDDELKEDETPIFKGIRLYINGYTGEVGLRQLTEIFVRRGGTYVPYLDKKGLVTHILASNLTPKKLEELKALAKIVKPAWLHDSLSADKVLDWRPYSLYNLDVEENVFTFEDETSFRGTQVAQKSLFSMGVGKPTATQMQTQGVIASASKGKGKAKELTETHESLSERGERLAQASLDLISKTTTSTSASSSASFFSPRPTTTLPPPPKADYSESHGYFSAKPRSAKSNALLQDATFRANHTSAAGDSFIATYFEQSRLHHISTWKEQLKKLVEEFQVGAAKTKPIRKASTGTPADRILIFHVDFDCFFVSAGLTLRPDLRGKPVCVCHGGEGEGEASTSEIASCSYEARDKGVKNGMTLGKARQLCPDITPIPFEFDLYRSIASKFYAILLKNSVFLQAVSIDEVLMEVEIPTPSSPFATSPDPALAFAHSLRSEIFEATGCSASIGLSHNILLAKLATKRAKPASEYHLLPEDVESYIVDLPVNILPGVGWSTEAKLSDLKVKTVGDLLKINLGHLRAALGKATADKFEGYARGIDTRELEGGKERQSVSAEINYGIRFTSNAEAERFVRALGEEVAKRLREIKLKARALTLKIMRRSPDAPIEAPKFLGHGVCVNINSSSSISNSGGKATDEGPIIGEMAWRLLQAMMLPPEELRGVAITLNKLEKDGVPVDVVRERGQGVLSFGPPPAAKHLSKQSVAPGPPPPPTKLEPVVISSSPPTPAPRHPQPLRKQVSIVVISDDEEDEPSVAQQPSRPATRSSSRAPSKPPPVAPVFQVAPGTTPAFQSRIGGAVTKSSLASTSMAKEKSRSISAPPLPQPAPPPPPPKVVVIPASPKSITVEELVALGIDVEFFYAIPEKDQIATLKTRRAFKVVGVAPPRQVRRDAPPPSIELDLPVTLPVAFGKGKRAKTETDDILQMVEAWMDAADEGPAEEDTRKMIDFMARLLGRTSGQDVQKAVAILKYWKLLIQSEYEDDGSEVAQDWWSAWSSTKSAVEKCVGKEWSGRLVMF